MGPQISVHCTNQNNIGTVAVLRHFAQFGAITCAVVGGTRDKHGSTECGWINIFYAAE